jgi:zona occludens toxin
MAITAYTGLQGSGKTYQVVSHTILNALRQGRVVVTNIQLNSDVIREYLAAQGISISGGVNGYIPGAGGIVQFTVDQLLEDVRLQLEHDKARYKLAGIPSLVGKKAQKEIQPYKSFFPRKDAKGNWDSSIESVVQPGDLVVIDEAWEFWETGMSIPLAHHEFFRYHRHFKNAVSGVTCDVVLLSQHIGDLHAKVKNVIEMTVLTEKLVELGASNSFRISTFSRVKTSARPMSMTLGRYNPTFFTFYKSHDAGVVAKAKERRVDRRQVIWNNPFFKYVMPLAIITLLYVIYLGYTMYSSRVDAINKKAEKEAAAAAARKPSDIIDHRSRLESVPVVSTAAPVEPSAISLPSVTGYIQNGSELFVLINDRGNDVLLLDPTGFTVSHMRISGTYNGRPVTSFISTLGSGSKDSKLTPSSAVGSSLGGGS